MKNVIRAFFGHILIDCYFVVAIGLLLSAYIIAPQDFAHSLWVLLLPIPLAPFVEWGLHKYTLHRIVDPKSSAASYRYMTALHYSHHWEPNNIKHIFAPWSASLILFIVLFSAGHVVFNQKIDFLIFCSSVIFYFLYYEWTHLAHHTPNYRPFTAIGRHIRKAHSWHHYKNENYWWGVTNPLGDYLLGTFKDPKEVESSPHAKSLGSLKERK